MPNYVYSSFTVTGKREERERFAKMMFVQRPTVETDYYKPIEPFETIMDFGAIIAPPESMKGGVCEAWAVQNWGTKWTGFDVFVTEIDSESIGFQFTTAWNFPFPVFEALAVEFPNLIFDGLSYEEDYTFQYAGQINGDNSWGPAEIEFDEI